MHLKCVKSEVGKQHFAHLQSAAPLPPCRAALSLFRAAIRITQGKHSLVRVCQYVLWILNEVVIHGVLLAPQKTKSDLSHRCFHQRKFAVLKSCNGESRIYPAFPWYLHV